MPDSVPVTHTDEVEHRRILAEGINAALQGKISPILDVALATSPATSTTVPDFRVHPGSAILTLPLDAAGAAAGAYAIPGDQTFDIVHAASASARTVRCIIFG